MIFFFSKIKRILKFQVLTIHLADIARSMISEEKIFRSPFFLFNAASRRNMNASCQKVKANEMDFPFL